ncbi:carboxymuconolactone decarboxylase family protein [Neptuniibacter halophilus]|uniref:carboxymuconolactone decarboxylase family protein n=1 Tax=Neptuniibacter halophilus TaxID=651666 RepID=UPI002572BEAE|nr:carboxymuconolactone decarboxylase family protein [Neptuniibacter halophilus]
MTDKAIGAGETTRREVMGDEFVDRALTQVTPLTEPLQEWINGHAWGSVWQRDQLSRKERSLVTVAMLVALRAETELKGHLRGALNNGCTPEELREVLLQSTVYCGAPAAQEAFRAAAEILTPLLHGDEPAVS